MNRNVVSLLAIILFLSIRAHADDTSVEGPGLIETPEQHSSRIAWWNDARFGMFIHWGLYSEAAGYWNGQATSGAGEWIMTDMRIPRTQYAMLASQFDPVKFNADQWVEIAKRAGMKYIVITSKHHDGFCMFKTKATTYDIVDATPWHKDPLLELSRACQRQGIKFCVYYSIMDWHSPDQEAAEPDPEHPAYNPTHFVPEEKAAYIRYMKTELKELITQYHPSLIWFDGQWMNGWTDQDGQDLYRYLHSLDPKLIVNNRVGGAGDYETPEQYIPPNGLTGHYWETCMTLNDTWGYKRDDHDWKSAQTLIRNMVDIASKGGNYLLNVGPTGEGVIPEASVDRLKQIGDWMTVNCGAIYGTTASPFVHQLPWGRCTMKTDDGTTTLYLHVFDWPTNGELFVSGLQNKIKTAYLLQDGKKLDFQSHQDGLTISLPPMPPDKISSTVALKFKGAPDIMDFKLTADPEQALTLVRGASQTIRVSIESIGQFSHLVKLSASGLPIGMCASFNPESVPGSGKSTLTLTAVDEAAPGIYPMTIAAQSGSLKNSATLNLTLLNAAGNNISAIYSQGHAITTGGFDMNNYGYDSGALGDSATYGGTIMTLGHTDCVNAWSQTTVPLSGQGSTLKILAAAANGNQTAQTFTLHYSDGTSYSFTRDLSDWCDPQNYKDETKVVRMDHRLGTTGDAEGHVTYLYGYSFPIDDHKSVQYLTLPDNRNVVVLSIAVVPSAGQKSVQRSGQTPL